MAGEVHQSQPVGAICITVGSIAHLRSPCQFYFYRKNRGADPTGCPDSLRSLGQISIAMLQVYRWTGYLCFHLLNGGVMCENYRSQLANQLRIDAQGKQNGNALHKETFHLPEMSLSSKEEDSRCHPNLPLHQIWSESYALSTPDLHCAWWTQRENA